jgi:hypothetical protein
MSEYKNFGEGALFKNNRKTVETDFDYSGEIQINGETRWLNAWINTSAAGNKYMKVVVGNVKQPQENQNVPSNVTSTTSNVVQSAPQAVTSNVTADVDSQIPF